MFSSIKLPRTNEPMFFSIKLPIINNPILENFTELECSNFLCTPVVVEDRFILLFLKFNFD